MFQIQPAARVVALNTSKMRARREIYKILRDWRQYGMHEVVLDRANSIIYGSVGGKNCMYCLCSLLFLCSLSLCLSVWVC